MMGGEILTASQIAAHERSKAFRNHIATLAQKLKGNREAPVPKIAAPRKPERPAPRKPERPAPKKLERPTPKIWFEIVEEIDPSNGPRPSILKIQEVVGAHFSIPVQDLISHHRAYSVALPRQIAMYLCRELTLFSLARIAKKFGGRDHSTIHHGHEKISRLIASDAAFAGTVEEIRGRLTV